MNFYNFISKFFNFIVTLCFLGYGFNGYSDTDLLNHFKKSEAIFSKVVGEMSRKAAEKYNMFVIGTGGKEDKNGISLISITFERHKGVVPRREGRKMIVEIAEEFLTTINSNEEIRPFLSKHPFEINNFQILIINSTENNDDLFDPDIEVFSCSRERVTYRTRDPDDSYQYKSNTFESYVEALELVKRDQRQ